MSLAHHKYGQFELLKDMLQSNMPLPYSAFGLLIDNSLLLGAKEARVIFSHTFKEKYCLIEEKTSNLIMRWMLENSK